MGVCSGVCGFDYLRFRDVVVPALRAGEHHPVVRRTLEVLRAGHEDDPRPYEPPGYEGLAQVTAHLDDTFTACDLGHDFWVADGSLTDAKPYSVKGWGYEELVRLVEWMMTRETLTSYASLGAGSGKSLWWLFLDEAAEHPGYCHDDPDFAANANSPRLQELLMRLDPRYGNPGGYWSAGGSGEGISGWLDSAETRELANLLPRPPAEPTQCRPEREWECQQLVWAAIERTIENGTGLLWGRDLAIYYSRRKKLFAEGDTPPAEVPYPFRPAR